MLRLPTRRHQIKETTVLHTTSFLGSDANKREVNQMYHVYWNKNSIDNRKQCVLVPVPVSDHCEHFNMVLLDLQSESLSQNQPSVNFSQLCLQLKLLSRHLSIFILQIVSAEGSDKCLPSPYSRHISPPLWSCSRTVERKKLCPLRDWDFKDPYIFML